MNAHENFENEGEMLDELEFNFNNPLHRQEKEANSFASELLMPKEFLIKDLNEVGLDIDKLTEKYQVSEQAMWIRLTTLRLAEKYTPKKAS